MQINAVNNYKLYSSSLKNVHKNSAPTTQFKQINQKPQQNIAFGGLISDIFSSVEEKKKKENLQIFGDFLKSTKNAKLVAGHKIDEVLQTYNDSFDNFNKLSNFVIHANPYYPGNSEESYLNISKITGKPESYVTYHNDVINLPFTRTEQKVKTPQMVTIGVNHPKQGFTEAIYNLDEKIVMQNVRNIDYKGLKADKITLFDVQNCTIPSLKFLKTMGCKSVVLNNVEIDENNTIKADSMITIYPLSNGSTRIEDVYLSPRILQAGIDDNAKEGRSPDWFVSIKSKFKLSAVGILSFNTYQDYLKKCITQEDLKEVYHPEDSSWHGSSFFYMEPVLGKGRNKYICRLDCKTIDNEAKQSRIKRTLSL